MRNGDDARADARHESADEPERVRVGLERDPVESPCPGCGAYYFDFHALGCDFEERADDARVPWDLDEND